MKIVLAIVLVPVTLWGIGVGAQDFFLIVAGAMAILLFVAQERHSEGWSWTSNVGARLGKHPKEFRYRMRIFFLSVVIASLLAAHFLRVQV